VTDRTTLQLPRVTNLPLLTASASTQSNSFTLNYGGSRFPRNVRAFNNYTVQKPKRRPPESVMFKLQKLYCMQWKDHYERGTVTDLADIFKELSQHFPECREKRHEASRAQNCDFRSATYDYQLQGIREEEALTLSRHNPHIRVQLLKKAIKPTKHGTQ